MPTSAKAVRILAAAFSSLAVAGNLFLRGRAVEFKVGKAILKLCRQQPGVWFATGTPGGVSVMADRWGEEWRYTFSVPEKKPRSKATAEVLLTEAGMLALVDGTPVNQTTPAGQPNIRIVPPTAAPRLLAKTFKPPTDEAAIREKAHAFIRQLSPLGFLAQKYPEANGGNLGQLEEFIKEFIKSGWSDTPDLAANTLAHAVRRVILGECKIVEMPRADSPVIKPIDQLGVPRNWVPEAVSVEAVDAREAAPIAKSFEQLIAEVGDWEPPADGKAVEASEFDMGPEAYGQQLLRCLDQLRQHRSTEPAGFSLAFGNGAKLVCTRRDFDSSITARIDLPPGDAKPPTMLAEAIKANEMENVHWSGMFNRLDEAAKVLQSTALAAWSSKMRRWFGRLLGELEKSRKWRLPTLAECAGDPEATRVWNAVHKPALEWQKTAEVGPPPLNNDESKRRPIWLYYGQSQRGTSIVTAEGFRQLAGGPPEYWCEVEPAPPYPTT